MSVTNSPGKELLQKEHFYPPYSVASTLIVIYILSHPCSEQPIFTCNAHVFHIDPKTKRTWITASSKAVSVSFFYDSSRNLYRIISVEGSKAVINSTITPNMTFTQTSQKFGQWSDVRANTVYGLGFSSESELSKFVEKFQEVKEATKTALAKNANATNGGSTANASSSVTSNAVTPITSANTSPITGRSMLQPPGTMDNVACPIEAASIDTPPPPAVAPNQQPKDHHLVHPSSPVHKSNPNANVAALESKMGSTSSAANSVTGVEPVVNAQQLKYENERLKLALAQSSANAKNWEIELTTLRNNNIRLTSALQESTANVDEWKRQLQAYKEENYRMKNQLSGDTTNNNNNGGGCGGVGGGVITEDLRKETVLLKGRIESLESELKGQELELKAANLSLRDKSNDPSVKQLVALTAQFAKHLTEMNLVQKEMEKLLLNNNKST